MIGVDLFAGAGGMSLGAIAAGIDVRFAVEKNPNAALTYELNHKGKEINLFKGDIRDVQDIDLSNSKSEVVVFGGPPCRGFSTSNQRTRSKSNQNNWLFKEYFRILKLLRPDWVVFENVKGLIETEKGFFLEEILNTFKNLGYATSWTVLNAADFGVPQYRYRLFIIGSLHGVKISLEDLPKKYQVTVREAIEDLPELQNGASINYMPYREIEPSPYARLMRGGLVESANHLVTRNADHIIERYEHVRPGGNWKNIPEKLMGSYSNLSKCHTGIYHRLHPDRPAKVIGNYRKNMLIHSQQLRGISVREAARLQSFPDWFEFKGSIGFQQQQVGNAVPPLVAKEVFETILAH